jgi:hypothetical protein
MKCNKGIDYRPRSERLEMLMIEDISPTEKKDKKPIESIKDSRGAFGWDNIDVLI